MNRRIEVMLFLVIAALVLVILSLKLHRDETLSAIQGQPKVVQPPPNQPVYLMVRCPKGGGDVVFNMTDDIKLRQIYPQD